MSIRGGNGSVQVRSICIYSEIMLNANMNSLINGSKSQPEHDPFNK